MIRFKNEQDKELFTGLNLILIMIYADLAIHAKDEHGIDLVITKTITTEEDDKKLGRASDSHQKAIALDIRANNIEKSIVKKLCEYINSKEEYKKYHYLTFSGIKRLAYDHGEKENYHIHLQIHQKFSNKETGKLAQVKRAVNSGEN